MAVEISQPFRVFTDVDGEPLEDGFIHIGAVNQNPQVVPISVFFDVALTIPAAQPIRTLGGYPSRTGTPSRLYVAEAEYSISVSNKNSTLIYSSLDSDNPLAETGSPSNGAALIARGDQIVNSITELRALLKTSASKFAFVNGYYAAGDGGGGQYYFDAADTTSADNGGTIIVATDGGRWKLADTKLGLNVRQFGAKGDGTANDSAAFQNAINVLPNGGVVYVPPGNYKIVTGLVANKGVLLKGPSRHDLSNNTNGSGLDTRPRLFWDGVAGGVIFTIKPAVVGDVVWGGGAVDIAWFGSDLASAAVLFDNTKFSVFDGSIRDVTFAGLRIDSTSGSVTNFSMKNRVINLEFIWGVNAASQNAHGLVLGGNTSTVPATQQFIESVSGLVFNGSLVRVAETDNAQFLSVHGVVQAGGTGAAVTLINAGAQGANLNVFMYCVGPVKMDGGLIGNKFLNYNSEGGGITQLAGSSSWDGELVDYISGKVFKSHVAKLRDKISISPNSLSGSGTTLVDAGLQWTTLSFSATATSKASCVIPAPYDLEIGVIEGVEVVLSSNGTNGGTYRIGVDCSTGVTAGIVVTPEVSMLLTQGAIIQYTPTIATFTFAPELAFAKNDHIFLTFKRLGADAADTNTDEIQLLGIRILYRSSGPTSAGSGTYTIPAWA